MGQEHLSCLPKKPASRSLWAACWMSPTPLSPVSFSKFYPFFIWLRWCSMWDLKFPDQESNSYPLHWRAHSPNLFSRQEVLLFLQQHHILPETKFKWIDDPFHFAWQVRQELYLLVMISSWLFTPASTIPSQGFLTFGGSTTKASPLFFLASDLLAFHIPFCIPTTH